MLNVFMLNVFMLNVFMLNVFMLNVFMLNVFMPFSPVALEETNLLSLSSVNARLNEPSSFSLVCYDCERNLKAGNISGNLIYHTIYRDEFLRRRLLPSIIRKSFAKIDD